MKIFYTFIILSFLSLVARADESDMFTTLSVGNVSPNLCTGQELRIAFTSSGFTDGSNVFSVELSDENGTHSDATPNVIGTLQSTANQGYINVVLPADITLSPNYSIRIHASTPSFYSDNVAPVSINCTARDYYWVGGAGIWSDINHWAKEAEGINFHTEAPMATDNVIFTEQSFPNGGTITVEGDVHCLNMTWEENSGNNGQTQLFADYTTSISIHGNLVMADNVYRDVNIFNFVSNGDGFILDLADNTTRMTSDTFWETQFYFRNNSGYQLSSDLEGQGVGIQNSASLVTNNHDISLASNLGVDGSASMFAGNSKITLQGISIFGNFNAESSTVVLTDTDIYDNSYISGSGSSFNNVELTPGDFRINGNNTFANLVLKEDVRVEFEVGLTQTINNSFEALGTRSKMIQILSSSPGNTTFLDVKSSLVLVNYVVLSDNRIDNDGGTNVLASNSLDLGGNVNWNIQELVGLPYFWVGGSGKWSDTNHWATEDGGSLKRSLAPGLLDDVFFTSNSFPSGGVLTIDEPSSCNNFDWQDGSTAPSISAGAAAPFTVRGHFKLAEGVNRSIEQLNFESSQSNNLTFNDQRLSTSGAITFSGPGIWSLQDSVSAASLTLKSGTLITNGHNISTSSRIDFDGGTASLGNSTITTRYFSSWATISPGSSTVVINSYGYLNGQLTLNSVVLDGQDGTIRHYATGSYNNLKIVKGSEVEFNSCCGLTINNNLEILGTRDQVIEIYSDYAGNQLTIDANAFSGGVNINLDFIKITDIILDNGSASDEPVSNSYDGGGNQGWNFSLNPLTSEDYYWIGGQGMWTDASNWSSTDGGTNDKAVGPGFIDNVFFTTNSFNNVGDTVLIDDDVHANNIFWNDGSFQPVWDDGSEFYGITIGGSLTISNGVTRSVSGIIFDSQATNNLISLGNNEGVLNSFEFYGGGTWTLLDSMAANSIYLFDGKLRTNGQPLNAGSIYLYYPTTGLETPILDMGSSEITLNFLADYSNGGSIIPGSSTLIMEDGSEIITDGFDYFNLECKGSLTINGNNNFNSIINHHAGEALTLQSGRTIGINSELSLQGASLNPILLQSTTEGSAANITAPPGATIVADHVALKNNNASGGASFTATNSSNFGNVSGWNGLLAGQTITFNTSDQLFADGAVTLDGSSDSGLPVSYELINGNANLSSDVLTPGSVGLVEIKVTQAGNSTYGEAVSQNRYIYFTETDLPNELGNMREATIVIGQKDFESNDTYFDINQTPQARKSFITKDGKLITTGSRRALIWNEVPTSSDTPADVVIGQKDFVSDDYDLSPSSLYISAFSVEVAPDGRLLIADYRGISIWNSVPTVNYTPADVIIGQDNFSTDESGTSATRYSSAIFFTVSPDQKLIVSDLSNNRVLIYNEIPTTNGAAADIVLGQPSMDVGEVGTGRGGMSTPSYPAVSPDGELFIPDARNNRILVYNSVPTVSGTLPDRVLGQPDFDTNEENLNRTGFNYPYSVAISWSGKFAVSDRQNQRILVWNSIPPDANTPADYVLGQPDFETAGRNTGGVSGRGLNDAYAVTWDQSENLYVGDLQNNRFLVWGAPDREPPSVLGFDLLDKYSVGSNDQVSSGQIFDRSGISEAKAYWQELSYFTPNNPNYEEANLTHVGDGVVEFDLSIMEDKTSRPIGVQYYFHFVDNVGNEFTSETMVQNIPAYYPSGLPLETFGIGNAETDYELISVPLTSNATVNDIFASIHGGSYDNTKLRIFEYENSLIELTGSSSLDVGDAYFALAAPGSSSSISLPAGEIDYDVTSGSQGKLYSGHTIDLKQGWNLIGNPFLHSISWPDVIAYNNISSEVSQFQVYNSGWNTSATQISVGQGVAVFATVADYQLRIPAKRSIGGRVSPPSQVMNSLEEDHWEVILYQQNEADLVVQIGGFGMETTAEGSFDKFDQLNPPVFNDNGTLEFTHPEFFYNSFKKDIQPSTESGVWSFEFLKVVENKGEEVINWDNSYFGDGPDLFLVDKTHFQIINMRETSSYSFDHAGTTKFEVYFGRDAYKELLPKSVEIHNAYPNPFTSSIKINVAIPNTGDDYQIRLVVYDAMGKLISQLPDSKIEGGYHSFEWNGLNNSGQNVPSGIYAYRVIISGSDSKVVTGKIVKE